MKVLMFLVLFFAHGLCLVIVQVQANQNAISVPLLLSDARISGRSIGTISSPWRVSTYSNILKRKLVPEATFESSDSNGWTGIPKNETLNNSTAIGTGETIQRRDGSAVVGVKVTVSDAIVTTNSSSPDMTKGSSKHTKKDLSSFRALSPNPSEFQSSRMIVHYNHHKPIEPVQLHQQQSRIIVSAAPQLHPSGTIDPYHPIVQHSLNTPPHNPLQPPQHQRHALPSNHNPFAIRPKYEIHHDSLVPLDKTLVYVSMITTWIFWILTFTTYYSLWGPGHNVIRGYVPHGHGHGGSHHHDHHRTGPTDEKTKTSTNVSDDSETKSSSPSHSRTQRSLDSNRWNFNWGQVIEMIRLAQESYEKFDFQSMDCQKKALCELSQKQEHFGETGRKITNTFSVIDTLETLPMPTIVLQYLKEYKDAVNQGRNSGKECGVIYPKCEFSIKETFVKFQKKSVGKAHQPK